MHHSHGNFPPFDSTYFISHVFWLFVSFGLFYLFIAKVIVPLVGIVLDIRHNRIASDLDKALKLKTDAEDIQKQNEDLLSKARVKFKSIIEEARREAKNVISKEREESEAVIAERLKQIQLEIDDSKQSVLNSISAMANEIMPKIITKVMPQGVALNYIDNIIENPKLNNKGENFDGT